MSTALTVATGGLPAAYQGTSAGAPRQEGKSGALHDFHEDTVTIMKI